MCYLTLDDIKKSLFSTKDYVQAIINIINTLDSKILEFKRQINKYEFTDISIMAINIVKNNEDIREELKNSFNEICIDEYQDTSDLQEIFINLISNNNVYMVGDIKQSIYRFRNANPMLFKEKYDLYSNSENGFKIDLNKNFRSRMEVLDDINLIFNRIMDNEIGGASYKESHNMIFGNSKYISDGYTNQNYNLEIYNYPYDKDSVFKNEEIEAFIIANDIKHKINEDYLIYDKDSQQLRKANFSDFVILMDRASAFDTYKKIFEYLNIPTTLYKDNNIVSENELLIIKNIIGLIIKINENNFDTDFIHMFMSISRSYIKKIDDDELFEIIKNSSYKETELYNICFKISQNIDNLTNSELFEIIVLKFDFINSFIKVGNIENKINIINYLQKTFEDLDSIGYGIYDLNNYLENIISNNKQINISMNIDNTNSVKIMTIHKSKGLEFPICYFSGFDKNFNLKDLNERILYNNKYGIITPYFNEGLNSLITKDIIKYNYIKDDISERIRLLYVALTRAKEKMIIVANINEDELHNTNNSIIDTYLRSKYRSFKDILLSLGDNLKKYISNIKLETLNITRDYNNIKNYNFADIINKTDNKIITTKINVQNDIVLNKHFSKNEKTIIDLKLKNNLEKGLYLHELFESTNFLEPDYSNINEEDSQYIKNFLNQDIMKNIKNATIYHEYEFLYEENNIKYHGIIDLLVIYDDYIDIIDYKLLNVISEDYIKQLNGYKSYIELEFNKNANIYLYSILNNTITKVQ